jgi:hypothetical protein
MKKLLHLAAIALAAIVAACGGKDDDGQTTFVIKSDAAKQTILQNYKGIISGYIDANGICRKIAEHGTLLSGGQTEEITLDDAVDSIRIYMPMVLLSDSIYHTIGAYPIVKNTKNVMIIEDWLSKGMTIFDENQFPR